MTDDIDTTDSAERMVLRTVYLPPELDERLRVSAFRANMSKGDIIRKAVERELASITAFGIDLQSEKPASKGTKAAGSSRKSAGVDGPAVSATSRARAR